MAESPRLGQALELALDGFIDSMIELREGNLGHSTPVAGNGNIQSADSYVRGFSRCLTLSNNTPDAPKYSEQFHTALHAYFESFGLLDHPRVAEWRIDHSGARVAHAFNTFIPWCQDLSVKLEGARILEVGCGTGSSTVALAAHAKYVLACDPDQPSINVARIRLNEDGFANRVRFLLTDPNLNKLAAINEEFDVAVLYGVLEHMLPNERENVFRVIWSLLRRGGKLVVYETPNRLCFKDEHTTGLIGWSWLPPRLALRYGRWRRKFQEDTDLVRMYRLGFGMTYSELKTLLQRCAAQYAIRYRYIREPLYQRVMIKAFTVFLKTPRWAFLNNLNLVIEKC